MSIFPSNYVYKVYTMGKNGKMFRKDNNIISYKHGLFTYRIKRTPDGLICPCNQNTSKKMLDICCDHIKGVIKNKLLDEKCIKLYPKVRSIISINYDDVKLCSIVNESMKYIMSDDCGFCCDVLSIDRKNEGWVMCEHCYKLAHAKCFTKSRTHDSKCMYCRYDSGIQSTEQIYSIYV